MSHIHTEPGQIDYIAEVFIVFQNKVLIRFHDKYHIWIAPGGHIELDETPEEAAIREAKEETGLDVVLYRGERTSLDSPRLKSTLPPMFMNMHVLPSNPEHRHISMIYFATSETDRIVQPENHEKTECRWMTSDEVVAARDMDSLVQFYALKALDILAP